MKKLILIFICLFCTTACYDNIELNDLAIITGVGIDYENNEFSVTYEILNDMKNSNDAPLSGFTVTGKGKNISDAFINTNYKIGKKAYFAHLKIVIISKSIVQNNLDKITDYLLRDASIRDEFKLIAAMKDSPSDILNTTSNDHPIASELIFDLLENDKYNNNLSINESYENIVSKLISNKYDIIINSISLQDKEITLDNSIIFSGIKYKKTLSQNESILYNLLTKNVKTMNFTKTYNNKDLVLSIVSSKTKYKITKDTINITLNLEGKIVENNPDFDLKNGETYQKLSNDFSKLISDEVKDFIQLLQDNNSDILGFKDIYYKDTRKELNNIANQNIIVKTNLKINSKGFTFSLKDGKE